MNVLPLALILLSPWQGGTINVFAAASLKEPFSMIATNYEKAHPHTKVQLNFAGSQLLAAQIGNGAPADVFASADQRNLDRVPYDKSTKRVFATNRLALVVRSDLTLKSIKDLSKVKRLVVADPSVPVGRYASTFLLKAAADYGEAWYEQVDSNIVSKEQDVKAVLTKVLLGEADVGIVYVSDAKSARGKVGMLTIPERLNIVAEYPIAVPNTASNGAGAKEFIRFVLSKPSQDALFANGFTPVKSRSQMRPLQIALEPR